MIGANRSDDSLDDGDGEVGDEMDDADAFAR